MPVPAAGGLADATTDSPLSASPSSLTPVNMPAPAATVPASWLPALPAESVAWFFTESEEDARANKNWKPYCVHDSANLEAAYRAMLAAGGAAEPIVRVRGTLYDVDIKGRVARAAYWNDPPHIVRRGTWFRPAQHGKPCQENLATELENIVRSRPWLALPPDADAATAAAAAAAAADPPAAKALGGKAPPPRELYRAELPCDKAAAWYSDGSMRLVTKGVLMKFSAGEELVRGYGALRGAVEVDTGLAKDNACQCGRVTHLVLVCLGGL